MSKAAQIAGTLKHFFPSEVGKKNSVWLLKVRISKDLEAQNILRWESPDASVCGQRDDEGLFPHLYFPAGPGVSQDGDAVPPVNIDGSDGLRLFLTKADVESVLEVVSDPDVSGYDISLQNEAAKQWLI